MGGDGQDNNEYDDDDNERRVHDEENVQINRI